MMIDLLELSIVSPELPRTLPRTPVSPELGIKYCVPRTPNRTPKVMIDLLELSIVSPEHRKAVESDD